jgi:hypothetical protein
MTTVMRPGAAQTVAAFSTELRPNDLRKESAGTNHTSPNRDICSWTTMSAAMRPASQATAAPCARRITIRRGMMRPP